MHAGWAEAHGPCSWPNLSVDLESVDAVLTWHDNVACMLTSLRENINIYFPPYLKYYLLQFLKQ